MSELGRNLKEFTVGERFESRGRTIRDADDHLFGQFTVDWSPMHVDEIRGRLGCRHAMHNQDDAFVNHRTTTVVMQTGEQ